MTNPADAATPKDGSGGSGAGRRTHLAIAIVSLVVLMGFGAIGLICSDAAAAALLLSQHGPAIVGAPAAVLLTTGLVSGARAIEGDFVVSILGVEFKGGAAFLLAWLGVFTALVLAIRALW